MIAVSLESQARATKHSIVFRLHFSTVSRVNKWRQVGAYCIAFHSDKHHDLLIRRSRYALTFRKAPDLAS